MSGDFKTRMCTNFSLGHCTYGNKCRFAHGHGIGGTGVHKHLPHWRRGLVGDDNRIGNVNRDYRMIDELKICRMFYNGKKCAYEDRCRFRHVSPDKVRESSVISVKTTDHGSSARLDGKGFVNWGDGVNSKKPVVWKTKLCNSWEMTGGGCPYGKICYFAHGQAELQKFGGHFALKSGTVPTYNSKIVPIAMDGIGTSYKQQVKGKESRFKWKEIEKIRGIYADWIEDMPFLHSSLNKVEN